MQDSDTLSEDSSSRLLGMIYLDSRQGAQPPRPSMLVVPNGFIGLGSVKGQRYPFIYDVIVREELRTFLTL